MPSNDPARPTDRVAVLLPCYNEASTIGTVVRDFRASLPAAEIYVYDNNSTDETARIAREAGAIVRNEPLQGKGRVIRRMFREVDADCYIMADGDDTYPAGAGPEMAEQVLKHGADMVVGDRLSSTYFTENQRRFHNTGNTLVRKSINMLFHTDIRDVMTGYRAFSRLFVKTMPVVSKGFEIETEMSIHAADKDLNVTNLVIEYRDRPEGSESKLDTVGDGIRVLRTIARLFKNYRPLAFFSLIAAVLAVAGVGMFIPVLVTYFRTGLVPNFPTLIVAVFFILAALQAFFGGLILDVMRLKNRHDFEMRLIDVADRQAQRSAGRDL